MTALEHLSGLPKFLNPRLTPLAHRLPPLAVLHHRGRTSGRSYDTPVQAYPVKDGFLVGMAYGTDVQWAKNLLAAGGGEITRAGKRYTLTQPRRRGPEALADLPAPVAFMMRSLGITEFMAFDAAPAGQGR